MHTQEAEIELPLTSDLVLGQRKKLGEFFKGDIPNEVNSFEKNM